MIDIKTETLLSTQSLNKRVSVALNKLRTEQLKRIDEIQNRNINLAEFDSDFFYKKWSNLIEKVTFEQKVQIIKAKIIKLYCLLIDDEHFESGISI